MCSVPGKKGENLMRGKLSIASVSVVLSLAIVACAGTPGAEGKSESVSRADFGEDWPLTVDSGVLSCEDGGYVYFTADGTRYAVNGFAMTKGDAPRINTIWANDPTGLSPRKNIGPLIDRGLALCE
jgi:hypothetical protein